MPSGPRVRANNVYGTISDNPLLIGAVSFTSLGLSLLPAISGQHAVIVFDPKREFGEPEIVVVTSHLALGTTATITRGTYGTSAREHPQGTAWAHVPVGPDDYTAIVTSSTRPSDPFNGQIIYETDTGRWSSRLNSIWIPSPHNPPACRVFNSANISVPHNTVTALTFNSERFDTDTMHSTSVSTGRITFNTAGVYLINAGIAIAAFNDYSTVAVRIRLNGTTNIAASSLPQNTQVIENLYLTPSCIYKVAVGDFAEITVYQFNAATAARNVLILAQESPEFSATWIGVG